MLNRRVLLYCSLLPLSSPLHAGPVEDLAGFLKVAPSGDTAIPVAPWTRKPLTKREADQATQTLITHLTAARRKTLEPQWQAKAINAANQTLKFEYRTFGDKPAKGRSLWISMHGGGSTTTQVNDGQWKNQIRLYEPSEGIYLAPRAPTDSWNMWHQSHIDALLDRLIEAAIVCADVDPDRVYLLGYSAGGDGVYQLAPRMADRFAAAAMMAGHPNDAKPDGLRNLPFAVHMGANDSAFKRNEVAKQWGEMLDQLQKVDPKGYPHIVKLHEGKGHWMDRQDSEALPWMASKSRITQPERIVWVQSSTTHNRFYWVAVETPQSGSRLDLSFAGNTIAVDPSTTLTEFTLLVNDHIFDLDQPIRITAPGCADQTIYPNRSIHDIWTSLKERFDPAFVPTTRVKLKMEKDTPPPTPSTPPVTK